VTFAFCNIAFIAMQKAFDARINSGFHTSKNLLQRNFCSLLSCSFTEQLEATFFTKSCEQICTKNIIDYTFYAYGQFYPPSQNLQA
jgi:hypothetical protein